MVAEDDVLKDANGGSVRSGYWLVYISKERFHQISQMPINKFDSIDIEMTMSSHPYAKLANENIK